MGTNSVRLVLVLLTPLLVEIPMAANKWIYLISLNPSLVAVVGDVEDVDRVLFQVMIYVLISILTLLLLVLGAKKRFEFVILRPVILVLAQGSSLGHKCGHAELVTVLV